MTFDFSENCKNQLLINPRLSDIEKSVLLQLQDTFENKYGKTNYFLVPSSGSSQKKNESVKLIALHRDAVLNSAKRFNRFFQATATDDWGLVLPRFHVAGLGIYARAYIAGAKVFEIVSEQVRFLSLVPTQVFDYVSQNKIASSNLKKVFVGAGALHPEIKQKALALGWPLVETYGMTETASMIAVKDHNGILNAMPGVQVSAHKQRLQINCDSLLTCYLQKIDHQIILTEPIQLGWYQTEDQAHVNGDQIDLLGRASDYIKILGEGVSLAELKDQMASQALKHGLSPNQYTLLAVDHNRSGSQIILAVENSVNSVIIKKLVEDFNQAVRPYEKISQTVWVIKIPLSDLGKVKTQELTEMVLAKMQMETV